MTAQGSEVPFFTWGHGYVTHEQNIICSKTYLDGTMHEQIIIHKQLFAGQMVGSWPMVRERKMHSLIISNSWIQLLWNMDGGLLANGKKGNNALIDNNLQFLNPAFVGYEEFNNLQWAALLTSFWCHWFNMTKIFFKFGEQQLVMVNHACGFNQSETGKYFQWIIITVTSPIVINMPTRGLLAPITKDSFVLWLAKFNWISKKLVCKQWVFTLSCSTTTASSYM